MGVPGRIILIAVKPSVNSTLPAAVKLNAVILAVVPSPWTVYQWAQLKPLLSDITLAYHYTVSTPEHVINRPASSANYHSTRHTNIGGRSRSNKADGHNDSAIMDGRDMEWPDSYADLSSEEEQEEVEYR